MSWIVPDPKDSEHPPALISTGQAYVTEDDFMRGARLGPVTDGRPYSRGQLACLPVPGPAWVPEMRTHPPGRT